ncbi:hypothetical protein I4U23_005544 [Adineta vaga]|nr:hypothetical protein I4U23_005544 [Adineta vaga]
MLPTPVITKSIFMDIPELCYALFIDISNYLYCSLDTHHKIMKKWLGDNGTMPITIAGTGVSGMSSRTLNGPCGIFVDLNSNLYVADCFNNRIQLFQSEQTNATTVVGEKSIKPTIILKNPTGITIDGDGYLYIVDQDNNRIIRGGSFDFRCILGCAAGGKDPLLHGESYKLLGPQQMAFDSYGNIYVADSNNRRIQKFFYSERSCESETTTKYAAILTSKPMVSHSTKTLVPSLMLWLIIFAVYI